MYVTSGQTIFAATTYMYHAFNVVISLWMEAPCCGWNYEDDIAKSQNLKKKKIKWNYLFGGPIFWESS